MRKLSVVFAAMVAAVFVSAPAAAARPSCAAEDWASQYCFFAPPAGWIRVHYGYRDCSACRVVGDRGVEQGDWPEYHCSGMPVGLDFIYALHVPPVS